MESTRIKVLKTSFDREILNKTALLKRVQTTPYKTEFSVARRNDKIKVLRTVRAARNFLMVVALKP